mmetsp:Transcript_20549/g.61280  ORF Transcript_20549/g.61280 Transcript_20549/m.61280 type:complete len:234 (+) Transcript_20549:441-1142(+)
MASFSFWSQPEATAPMPALSRPGASARAAACPAAATAAQVAFASSNSRRRVAFASGRPALAFPICRLTTAATLPMRSSLSMAFEAASARRSTGRSVSPRRRASSRSTALSVGSSSPSSPPESGKAFERPALALATPCNRAAPSSSQRASPGAAAAQGGRTSPSRSRPAAWRGSVASSSSAARAPRSTGPTASGVPAAVGPSPGQSSRDRAILRAALSLPSSRAAPRNMRQAAS